ncbi:helix-turn-helix transcriptional regulator [Catenovulum sediminis]|uniref:Helix-turn-helix transcriptional regulator n=1 Tax=Catenovulum sediminis TaxID=1740262 RepID=A0ABV1RHD3_9ALTE
MKTLADRLIISRKKAGLTQVAFAKKLGISQASVALWERGNTEPKGGNLNLAAKILNVSVDWLLLGKESDAKKTTNSNNERSAVKGRFDTWDSKTPLDSDDVELPFFREVELSAGIGSEVVREDNGFKLRFSRSTLRRYGIDPANAACVQINGDSMEPILPDGSTVGVDSSKTQIVDGKMYAIDQAGLLRVKVLHRIPGGLRVRSFNSDEHPDEIYKGDELNDIRVIGKVFWSAAFHF